MWWAIGSMLLWGISGAYAAVAGRGGTALGAWVGATLVEALVVLPLLGAGRAAFSWSVIVVGVSGGLAYGLFFKAVEQPQYPVALMVSVTALYPLVTAFVGWMLLGQSLNWKQWLGVSLAVLACVLISQE